MTEEEVGERKFWSHTNDAAIPWHSKNLLSHILVFNVLNSHALKA